MDGNGRTGRILLNYLAIIIKGEQDEERKRYYSDLEAATADRTVWLSVLEHIIGGDKNLQRTLQEIAGYALSSFSALRLIFWLYGPAGTGKSTFSELLSTILDDMAVTLDTKHLGTTGERERLAA